LKQAAIPIPADCDNGYTQAVYRWYNPSSSSQARFYTLEPSGGDLPSTGYNFEGIAWYDFVAQQTGTVAIDRFEGFGDNFYTTNQLEEADVQTEGYTLNGNIGYVFTAPQYETLPIYRYYDSSINRHFYTIYPGNENLSGYSFEEIIGYAYTQCISPTSVSTSSSGKGSSSSTTSTQQVTAQTGKTTSTQQTGKTSSSTTSTQQTGKTTSTQQTGKTTSSENESIQSVVEQEIANLDKLIS